MEVAFCSYFLIKLSVLWGQFPQGKANMKQRFINVHKIPWLGQTLVIFHRFEKKAQIFLPKFKLYNLWIAQKNATFFWVTFLIE